MTAGPSPAIIIQTRAQLDRRSSKVAKSVRNFSGKIRSVFFLVWVGGVLLAKCDDETELGRKEALKAKVTTGVVIPYVKTATRRYCIGPDLPCY